MAKTNWTQALETELFSRVEQGVTVSTDTVNEISESMDISTRSVASKLRKSGYEVESAAKKKSSFTEDQTITLTQLVSSNPGVFTYADLAEKFEGITAKQIQGKILYLKLTDKIKPTTAEHKFSDQEVAEITAFVEANEGTYTYGEIAAAVCGGKFTNRQVQGILLHLKLSGSVKPTPKVEAVKKYSDEEQELFITLAKEGKYLEEISDAIGHSIASLRGKALSLLRNGLIEAIPTQRDSSAVSKKDLLDGLDYENMSVADLAETLGRTEVGIKGLLTRRAIDCSDYSGSAKAAKKAAKEEALAE